MNKAEILDREIVDHFHYTFIRNMLIFLVMFMGRCFGGVFLCTDELFDGRYGIYPGLGI